MSGSNGHLLHVRRFHKGCDALHAGLTRATVPPGELVFAEGDHGDDFYVIEQGEAEVATASWRRSPATPPARPRRTS